jgi:biopolymer transport protein ExbD
MKFKRNNKRRVVANVEMTPLIDVVFQLLIFFMVSSTFVAQTSIPIELPVGEGATKLEIKDVVISLSTEPGGPDSEGKITVEGGDLQGIVEVADWSELTGLLSEIGSRKPDVLVLIRSDRAIPSGRLVRVLGIASSLGIKHYGLAAQAPEDE